MDNTLGKPQLGKIERLALSEAFVTNSSETITLNDLNTIITNTIGDNVKSKIIYDDSKYLFENYSTNSIIKKGWKLIVDHLIPAFTKNGNITGELYEFDFLIRGEKSSYWKACVVLLSLWKFIYPHRYRETPGAKSTIELYGDGITDYKDLKKTIEKIIYFGIKWLDTKIEQETNWKLPPVYSENQNDPLSSMAIQEQSMYLFTRSHLCYSEVGKVDSIALEPIKNLLEAYDQNSLCWPDIFYASNGVSKRANSIRATCMAITSLSELLQNNYIPEDLIQKVNAIGTQLVKRIANAQNPDGSWSEFFSEYDTIGNVPATSYALYYLDRFCGFFNQSIPTQIFFDAQIWLSQQITTIIKNPGIIPDDKIEEVSRALPALARSCPYLTVIWYRRVFQSLFEKSNNSNSGAFSISDAWKLYATTEILRRPAIAKYLQRVI